MPTTTTPAEHTYVIDTSVLLSDPRAMLRFKEQEVVLPVVVITELEGKRHHPELGYFARQALRILDDLRGEHGRLDAPVPVGGDGGTLRVELNHTDPSSLPAGFRLGDNDTRILAVAKNLANEGRRVTVVSKDLPMRVKASACGLVAEEYRNELTPESGWTGMRELDVTVERPIPFRDPPEPVSEDSSADREARPEGHVPEDMSAGTGPEGQVAAEDKLEARAEGEPVHEGEAEGEPGDRRKRRRKRRRGGKPTPNPEGPPERMCGLCAQKLSRVQAREQPCKVHGCSRTWTWDRASQMRAWVLSGSDDVDYEPPAPRRMCEVCREFCRTHPDREVPCGRPGCERSWTFKTGAQLQAFLAGRLADPLKLCGECAKGEFAASFRPGTEGGIPEGAETMPCVVPGCEGTWLYIPGMRLRETAYGELSPERMCDAHRVERGFAAASPHEAVEVEVTAADLAADEVHEHDHDHDHDHEDGEHEHDPEEIAAADAPADEPESADEVEAGAELSEPEPN